MKLVSNLENSSAPYQRILLLGSTERGVSIDMMPAIQSLLAKLEGEDVQVWRSGFCVKFRGKAESIAFERSKGLMEGFVLSSEGGGFGIGITEGASQSEADDRQLIMGAIVNGWLKSGGVDLS